MLKKIINKLKFFSKQLFSVNNIDNHVSIYILGIKIRQKLKPIIQNVDLKNCYLNKAERTPLIIASLTTFPQRINIVSETIKTILAQSIKPDKVILWLAEEQFPQKETELPEKLIELKNYGLTIKWCKDTKSYKKLIPTLKEYPEEIIITFDDDIYYPLNTIELLYNEYLKNPNYIYTNRARRFYVKDEELYSKTSADLMWSKYNDYSYLNKLTGCGGVLYPPNSLCKEVFNEEKFTTVIPTQDDVWFWAMAVLNHTKIKLVANFDIQLPTIPNSQQYGLSKINKKQGIGVDSLDASRLIVKEYPQIIKIIKEDVC